MEKERDENGKWVLAYLTKLARTPPLLLVTAPQKGPRGMGALAVSTLTLRAPPAIVISAHAPPSLASPLGPLACLGAWVPPCRAVRQIEKLQEAFRTPTPDAGGGAPPLQLSKHVNAAVHSLTSVAHITDKLGRHSHTTIALAASCAAAEVFTSAALVAVGVRACSHFRGGRQRAGVASRAPCLTRYGYSPRAPGTAPVRALPLLLLQGAHWMYCMQGTSPLVPGSSCRARQVTLRCAVAGGRAGGGCKHRCKCRKRKSLVVQYQITHPVCMPRPSARGSGAAATTASADVSVTCPRRAVRA